MATISGPFYTNTDDNPVYSKALQQWKYKCAPRKAVPLPYQVGRYSARGATGYWNYVIATNTASMAAIECNDLYSRAYDKFYGLALKRASLGLTLLDSPKSLTMIVRRATQLTRALRYLKRGNVRLMVSSLGIDDHPKTPAAMARVKKASATPANSWLEFTFGWSPLVSDIFSAVDVFQQDFPAESIRSKVKYVNYASQPWDGGSWYAAQHSGGYFIGGDVVVTNPNVLLAKQLGLTNLASIAWDAVPFSFVVDWFIPVNKYLLSLDNDFGIEIRNPYRGWTLKSSVSSGHVAHKNAETCVSTHFSSSRVIGAMPRPALLDRLRAPKLDPWLASTSLSLLIQQWNRMK